GAFTPEAGVGEYLLFSDGLDNFGERSMVKPDVALYTINAANRADPARLRQLAEASGGRFVDLTATPAADAAPALLSQGVRPLDVSADGATALNVASRHAEHGRWLVSGQLPEDRARLKLTVGRAGAAPRVIDIPVVADRNADRLTAAAWAQQQLAVLDAE